MLIFTYGTLKKGFRNHILLAASKYVQDAVTRPLYRLYDCGMYPCLVKDTTGNGRSIHGEIYEIDDVTLQRLDQLEGVPWLYQRDKIELENFNQPVIAYYYQDDVSEFIDCGLSWPRKR